MKSYLLVVAGFYLMIGAALTVLILGNMPVIVDGPLTVVWLVLIWPIVLWSFFSAGAMMFAVGAFILISRGLYRWMI